MWASLDDAAIGGVITAAVGALAAAGVLIYRAVKTANRTERRDQSQVYDKILDRYESRVTLLEEQGNKDRSLISRVLAEHDHCRLQVSELYEDHQSLHEIACRHREALVKLGQDPGEIPPLRPRPARPTGETEFLVRSAQNSAQLIKALPRPDEEVKS